MDTEHQLGMEELDLAAHKEVPIAMSETAVALVEVEMDRDDQY